MGTKPPKHLIWGVTYQTKRNYTIDIESMCPQRWLFLSQPHKTTNRI